MHRTRRSASSKTRAAYSGTTSGMLQTGQRQVLVTEVQGDPEDDRTIGQSRLGGQEYPPSLPSRARPLTLPVELVADPGRQGRSVSKASKW